MRRFIFKKPTQPKKQNDTDASTAHKAGEGEQPNQQHQHQRSAEIRNQAMENLRRARANLGDDLIQKMAAAMKAQNSQGSNGDLSNIGDIKGEEGPKIGAAKPAKSSSNTPADLEDIPINREKNLQTIMTFLQGLDDNDPLSNEIRSRLQKFVSDNRSDNNKPSIH